MIPASSAIVKEKHQKDICIYCSAPLKKWSYKIIDGLERRIAKCENGHEARIKQSKKFTVKQLALIYHLH